MLILCLPRLLEGECVGELCTAEQKKALSKVLTALVPAPSQSLHDCQI